MRAHARPGGEPRSEVRQSGATTGELEALGRWLLERGVTHAAIESTGVYWKPVFHILEPVCELPLGNTRDGKPVPGRKTGVADCAVLAELARSRMRSKIPELTPALEGRVRPHHRFPLKEWMWMLDRLEEQIQRLEEEIEKRMPPFRVGGGVADDEAGL